MTRNVSIRSNSGMVLTGLLMAIFLLLQSSLSLAQDSNWEAMRTAEEQQFLAQRNVEITAQDGGALFGNGVFKAAFSGEVASYDPTTGNYGQSRMAADSANE